MLKVVEKLTDDSSNATPFRLTKQEKEMLDPNYKKPAKRKVRNCTFPTDIHTHYKKIK